MQITREINLDIRKTVENSVCGNDEFHFFVDELTSSNMMPTYQGMADEKYAFDEMDDGFFEFLKEKASNDGIYIRLVFANGFDENDGEAAFQLEYGDTQETFRTCELDRILEFDFADFGIRVKGSCVTMGATVDGGHGQAVFFAEFGSEKANREYLSLDNPLNQHVIAIMENMIFIDE